MIDLFYEKYDYLRDNLRCVHGIVDGRLFVLEETSSAYKNQRFSLYVCEGNPYRQRIDFSKRNRMQSVGSVVEAKRVIAKFIADNPRNEQTYAKMPISMLPGGDGSEFYPTPMPLAGKMLGKVRWDDVRSVLEPSAGKGDLVTAVECMVESRKYSNTCRVNRKLVNNTKKAFDVIETDYNLRLLLRGMGLRLVGDDFLQYRTNQRYDLVLMNPPFSAGAAHLIHAIELMQHGGQIVCLLNAETIRNPYTNERKLLQQLLADYAASVEFVQNAFAQAERKSGVEVAIVHINIPANRRESTIFANAQKAVEADVEGKRAGQTELVSSDDVDALIQHYQVESKAGVELMMMYADLAPHIMDGDESYSKPLLQLTVGDHSYRKISNEAVNEYLHDLRYKYWRLFLNRPALQRKLTSEMSSEYYDKVREMADYEFTKHNIAQVLYDIQSQLVDGVEASILKLFDTMSAKHCMDNQKNIHYYTGWKTNKAHAVGMKAILPINGFSSFGWKSDKLDEYHIAGVLSDLEKSLHYLDKGEVGISYDITYALRAANEKGATEISLSYFKARFYKKGTCHITFHENAKPIIDRLNIFAGRNKGWLPPRYGRTAYRDMTEEERAVVDEFQGADEYSKVVSDPGKYILDTATLQPLLAG